MKSVFRMELDGDDFGQFKHPLPKERPRGRNHRTPQRTKDYESLIAHYALNEMNMAGLDVFEKPVFMKMVFIRADRTVVDLDNMEKAVMDALNGVVYRDDSLVYRKFAMKHVRPGRGGLMVIVTSLPSDDEPPSSQDFFDYY